MGLCDGVVLENIHIPPRDLEFLFWFNFNP